MSEIILKCINHVISVVNTPDISSGNVNYDTVLFELCPNWTGFTKTAVFYRSEDEVYYQMLDSDNRCIIPKEVLREKGKIRIGLFGVKDNKTITSDVVTYNVSQGAITTGLKPSDPTPDIYAQLIGHYSNLGAEIDLERKRIDEIVSGATADANAELRDIRIGADGTVYGSAGDAVRSQFKMIKEVNALAIVNEASGKEIIVTDSSDNEFKNLKVYGETTQRLGKNRIKCDASFMGNIIDGITFKGEYETPIGEGELQYIEVSGKFEPLNMDGGTTASSTSRTIGEATLSAGEYIFSQGYATTSLTPYLVLYLDGVRSSDLSTVGQTEKSIKLTKSTVVRLDIEVRVASGTTITTTKVYPMIRLASETDGTYEPYNGVDPSLESPKTVRGVKGKNELDCSGLTAQTINGVTFTPVYKNGLLEHFNVNGTASEIADYRPINISQMYSLKKGVYTISGCPTSGSESSYCMLIAENEPIKRIAVDTGNGTTFTIEEDVNIHIIIRIAKGYTANNLKFYPMVRDASITDGTYAPYDCVRFTDTGKNVLDCSGLSVQSASGITFTPFYDENGYLQYVNVNGISTDRATYYISNFTLKAGTYTLSQGHITGTEKTTSFLAYKKNGTTVYIDLFTNPNGYRTFTLEEDVEVRIATEVRESGATVSNVKIYPMIRLASITDATYEPYKGETADLSGIELHGIGDARDYIDLERGVIVRKCGVNTFDGSESWIGSSFLAGRYGIEINAKETGICMCSMAINRLVETVNCCHINQHGSFYINTSFATVDEWKAHLQANSMVVVYELETPIEEPLSDANLQALRELHSYKPTTVLTNDVGADMTLEYVADTKLYIDKRISELATAILNN